jgi:hypothetical protein
VYDTLSHDISRLSFVLPVLYFYSPASPFTVDKALKDVKRILDTTRNPRLIGDDKDDNHVYDDKFLLAETMTQTSLAALQTSLNKLGITPQTWQQMITWCQDEKQVVTMRLKASDSCSLLKEDVVEVADPTEIETKTTTTTGGSWTGRATTSTTKVVRKIKETHWQIRVTLKLEVFAGTQVEQALTIVQRESSTIVVTGGGLATSKHVKPGATGGAPIAPATEHKAIDLDLTWFLQQWKVESDGDRPATSLCQFAIDRTADTCKTPRRNEEVSQAISFHLNMESWGQRVGRFLQARLDEDILGQHQPVHRDTSLAAGTVCQLQNITKEPKFNGKTVVVREYIPNQDRYRVEPLDLTEGLPTSLLVKAKDLHVDASAGNASGLKTVISIGEDIFTPVQPILEDSKVLQDVEKLLEHHAKDLDRAVQHLGRLYPSRQVTKVLSVFEATTMLVCFHVPLMTRHYVDCIQFLEELLHQQVVQAIGKVVTPLDFGHFMRRHTRKLMGADYAPTPFSYAVRRPNHAPDGMLTIEAAGAGGGELIDSMVRHVPPEAHPPLQLPLSAATTVPITGDWFLHGWLMHQFSGHQSPSRTFNIGARARQFSSFILVIGTMSGPAQLDPQHAILLQNKDDLMIPLLTQVLPSAQDFKDAIQSLSPEQQDFCKAFRSMQLESSVLGVCVIQLKPQLEKLLGLTPGSLTKEMQLTQELMSIFIEYQIPSDLVAFDGPTDATKQVRLEAVKEHVQAVLKVIEAEKEKQLLEEEKKAELREAQAVPVTMKDTMESESVMMFDAGPALVRERGGGRNKMKSSSAPRAMTSMSSAPNRSFGAQTFSAPAPPLAMAAATQSAVTVSSSPQTDFQAPKGSAPVVTGSSAEDFTMLPKELDAKLDKLDTDNALRSTILKVGDNWTLKHQETLLSLPVTKSLGSDEISTEKMKAFDLLDALSRSGSLPIDAAELHVIVALSHCFEKDLMGTLIQDNVNPIAKAEKSALLLASTLHRKSPADLLAAAQDKERLTAAFPLLFEN